MCVQQQGTNISLVPLTALNHFPLLFAGSLGGHAPPSHALSYTRKVLSANTNSVKLLRNFSTTFYSDTAYLRRKRSSRLSLAVSTAHIDEWLLASGRKLTSMVILS